MGDLLVHRALVQGGDAIEALLQCLECLTGGSSVASLRYPQSHWSSQVCQTAYEQKGLQCCVLMQFRRWVPAQFFFLLVFSPCFLGESGTCKCLNPAFPCDPLL
jgi:hypothetical protein